MMRAILEGICFNLKRILTGVCSEDQLTEIRATGGFSQSPVFRQLMADVLGYPLIFPAVSEASALGAVFLGWQSIGKITDLSEAIEKVQLASQVPVQQTVKETYQKIFPIFVETQKQVAATYQPLAHLRQTLSTMNEK